MESDARLMLPLVLEVVKIATVAFMPQADTGGTRASYTLSRTQSRTPRESRRATTGSRRP